jgi:CBS domain-containing membrane protein
MPRKDMPLTFSQLMRGRNPMRTADLARASAGALAAVPLVGLAAHLIASGHATTELLMIGPVGASAVLAFAVPASPLAQPRNLIGGNLIGVLVGVSCALALHAYPALAAGVAVGASILVMGLLGCLHPPGTAIALGAVLVTAPVGPQAYLSVGWPVLLCSTLLTGAGMIFARLTGRSYPHRAPPPDVRVDVRAAEIDQALAHYGELLDIDRADLDALFRQVELQANQRLHGRILIGAIMANRAADPAAPTVRSDAPIEALMPILSSSAASEVAVVDEAGVRVGALSQTELLAVLYRAHVVEALTQQKAQRPGLSA